MVIWGQNGLHNFIEILWRVWRLLWSQMTNYLIIHVLMKMIEKSNVMGGIYETASTNLKSIVSVVMEGKGQIEYTGHQRKRSSRAISLIRRTNQEYQVCYLYVTVLCGSLIFSRCRSILINFDQFQSQI